MTQPVLLMTVGLPGSGKSTWARKTGFPVINPDSIRLALHGQAFRKESEPLVWALAHLMVQSLFLVGHKTAILDACNISEYRRREWKSPHYTLGCVLFKTPVDECIARDLGREHPVGHEVIQRMSMSLEWPTEKVLMTTEGPSGTLHYVASADAYTERYGHPQEGHEG